MENSICSTLPEELVVEILLRLPVKTLSRFKCVSMKWNALIGSSSFANWHFAHERNQEHLLVQHYVSEEKHAVALYIDDTLISRYEEPDHLLIPSTEVEIVGPSNGIFCVINASGKIACLNPATRQFRLLPDLVHSSYAPPHLYFVEDEFGFGLDPFGNYKVVSVQYFRDKETPESYHPCIISVYNSNTDSWRHFEEKDSVNSNRRVYKSLVNTYLNEVYYWQMEITDDNWAYVLAFDMKSETFREIKGPNDIEPAYSDLGLYGDSLAWLCNEDDKFIDVWVMEREGQWSRFFKVGPIEGLCYPHGFWKTNGLLLETQTSEFMSVYDISAKTLRYFEDHQNRYTFRVSIYKESLVSIKGAEDKCYLWDTDSDIVKNFLDDH